MTVTGGNTNTKPAGIGLRQFRDVVSHLSVLQGGITAVQIPQVALYRGSGQQGVSSIQKGLFSSVVVLVCYFSKA